MSDLRSSATQSPEKRPVISTGAKVEKWVERSGETSHFSSPGEGGAELPPLIGTLRHLARRKVRGFSTPLRPLARLRSGRNDRCFRSLRAVVTLLFVIAFLSLAACQTPHEFTTPGPSWRTRTGQLKYTSGERVLVGEVIVSQRGASDFQLEFQKGGGLPLLKLRMDSTTVRAEGIFARGSWQGAPDRAPKPLRGWVGLLEAFPKRQPDRFTVMSRDSEDHFDFIFSR